MIKIFALILVIGAVVLAYVTLVSNPQSQTADSQGQELVTVKLPGTLSGNAQIGQTAFEARCAQCHGANAAGQNGVAPPLIHKIYEPSHHGDGSFHLAVSNGVRQHHWPFGNMPPVQGLTKDDVTLIVTYIRELQRANGIN